MNKRMNIYLTFLMCAAAIIATQRGSEAQVFDGQQINATVTNNAFWKRSVNDTAVGIYSLQSVAANQGPFVTSIQTTLNACNSYTGAPSNSVFNVLPVWGFNDVGSPTDNLKQRDDALTAKFNGTTGHTHTGASGDAPQLPFTAFAPTAANSVIVSGPSGALGTVPFGTSGYFFTSTGPSSPPIWTVGPSGGSGGSGGSGSPPTVINTTFPCTALGGGSNIDWSTSFCFTKTLSANTTFTFSNLNAGQVVEVRITNTVANYTTSWPVVTWISNNGNPPIVPFGATTAIITLFNDGVTIYGSDGSGPAGPTGATGLSAAPTINGTDSSPVLITAVGGIPFSSSTYFNKTYISGNGGPIAVTAVPQIASCSLDGQQLILVGESDTNTVTIVDDPTHKVRLNGTWVATQGEEISLDCDSSLDWVEKSRSN